MAMVWRIRWRWRGRGSSFLVTSVFKAAQPSPGRSSTLSSIAWLTRRWGTSGSGGDGHELVEDGLVPGDVALGGLGLHELAHPAGIAGRLLRRLLVVDHVLGRLHDHQSRGVVAGAARPARRSGAAPGR